MLRTVAEKDFDAIVAPNRESERLPGPLDRNRLDALHALAVCHLAIGEAGVAARCDRFLYADRVVIGSRHRGRAPRQYAAMFELADRSGVDRPQAGGGKQAPLQIADVPCSTTQA